MQSISHYPIFHYTFLISLRFSLPHSVFLKVSFPFSIFLFLPPSFSLPIKLLLQSLPRTLRLWLLIILCGLSPCRNTCRTGLCVLPCAWTWSSRAQSKQRKLNYGCPAVISCSFIHAPSSKWVIQRTLELIAAHYFTKGGFLGCNAEWILCPCWGPLKKEEFIMQLDSKGDRRGLSWW